MDILTFSGLLVGMSLLALGFTLAGHTQTH